MAEVTKAKGRRPTSFELRARVVAAIEKFITEIERKQRDAAFSSNRFHLVIDDEYWVAISERAAPAIGLYLFSVPLRVLNLDLWAVGLGGE